MGLRTKAPRGLTSMLAFTLTGRDGVRSWHIGEKIIMQYETISQVDEVQADCDELEYIKSNFTNLPMSNSRVVRWFGDHARFIVAHLPRS